MEKEREHKGKGRMWALQQKIDQPMDEEATKLKNNMYAERKCSWLLLIRLAFQSLGVVYGDLGTSPLYVFYNSFPKGVVDTEDIVGALSLIIYSLTLVPLIKYVFFVCRASDNDQGGTFALYSLLCRHAKIKTIPDQHRTDERLTTYIRTPIHENSFSAKTKKMDGSTCVKEECSSCACACPCWDLHGHWRWNSNSCYFHFIGFCWPQGKPPPMRNELIVVLAVFISVDCGSGRDC